MNDTECIDCPDCKYDGEVIVEECAPCHTKTDKLLAAIAQGHMANIGERAELIVLRAQVVALEADVHQRDARIAELERLLDVSDRISKAESEAHDALRRAYRARIDEGLAARKALHTQYVAAMKRAHGEDWESSENWDGSRVSEVGRRE